MRARKSGISDQLSAISNIGWVSLVTVYCLLMTACYPVTQPTVKIALVAPFEGRYRNVGYEVIYAVRLAVREANANGGIAGYGLELLALDDAGDPALAAEQARKAAADPQVLAVIGHWLSATTAAALPEYDQAALPILATAAHAELNLQAFRLWPTQPCQLTTLAGCVESLEDLKIIAVTEPFTVGVPAPRPAESADPTFAERYRALSNGVEPGFYAVLAYDAAQLVFDAIVQDVAANGSPTRAGVQAALTHSNFTSLSGSIQFDSDHHWISAQMWEYVWQGQQLRVP
jgi:ABC-type branched-subunit amino acid transport system substrate-binding protein